MSRSMQFVVPGQVDTIILIEEDDFDGDGLTDLKITATVNEIDGYTADIRGLFWDLNDPTLAGVGLYSGDGNSADVTDSMFAQDGVLDLGNGANMKGEVHKSMQFDGGVEIGTQGIGNDDVQSTSFVLAADTALTLEDIVGARFGVRLTSTGEIGGPRDGSLKLVGNAPIPPVVNDDRFYVEFGDSAHVDVLANDSDADGILDPTTLAFTGADNGTATNDGGQLLFQAEAIDYDTTNSSIIDEMTYTACPLNLLSVLFSGRRNGPWDDHRQRSKRLRATLQASSLSNA